MPSYSIHPGKSSKNPFNKFSMTVNLIIANIAVYIIAMILIAVNPNYFQYIALKPVEFLQYPWTLLTHMFMHAPSSPFHLLINMFVLFSLGSVMERIIGRKRFLWFFIASGIFAGLLFVTLALSFGGSELGAAIFGGPNVPAVGASGAIFAIAGLFVVLLPKSRFSIIFFPFFSLPAYIMIPGILFLTWIATASTGVPVGNVAHFGGLIAGLIYGGYLRVKFPNKLRRIGQMFSQ